MAAPNGDYRVYALVRSLTELDLNAPAETVLNEVRYQLREDNRVLDLANKAVLIRKVTRPNFARPVA